MRLIAIMIFIFLSHCASGQALSLDDILNIRTMDSTELRTFAYERGFELREVDMDGWRSVHRYCSTSDSLVRFDRIFPTGRNLHPRDTTKRDNRSVYYHFTDKEALKEFKEKMKEQGFKFERTDRTVYERNAFTHNIYLLDDEEIDLAWEKLPGQKMQFTLIHYRRMN